MASSSNSVKRWRIRKKIKLMEYKGNKCSICGYDKIEYLSAFDFHHLDPSTKEFSIAGGGICKNIGALIKEVDKCILVCTRCHAEIHDKQQWENRKKILDVKIKPKMIKKIKCSFCKKEFTQNRKEQKFCCKECGRLGIRKTQRPDISILKKEIKEIGYKEMMKKYNIGRGTVYRWLKEKK